MLTRRSLVLLLLPLALLGACGDDDDGGAVAASSSTSTTEADGAAGPFDGEADHTLTIEDDGTELAVEVGAVIDVVLETCSGCGYSWSQMGDAGTGGLELVEERDVDPEPNAEGETGGGVEHWVRFEATAPGDSNITLGSFPPGDGAPEDVFDVAVHIAPEGDEVNDIVVLGAEDSGSTVTVEVGSTFDVALEQCIGCGYSWSVVTDPDAAVVVLDSESDIGGPEQVEGEEPIVGGMGEHVFHFSVAGAGTTTFELGYFPPGEQPAEESFTLTVEAS